MISNSALNARIQRLFQIKMDSVNAFMDIILTTIYALYAQTLV